MTDGRRSQRVTEGPVHFWVDGALVRFDDDAFDPAWLEVGLCYTTTRVRRGEPTRIERHAARLARDAAQHGLTAPLLEAVADALTGLAGAEFGRGDGIVRLQLGRDADGRTRLIGVPRPLGDEPRVWRLGRSPVVHPGPEKRAGAKLLGQGFVDDTRLWLGASPYDEALMFDAAGWLVEGSRSNIIVVDDGGRPCYADRALGGVSGIGLEVACECVPELVPARLDRAALDSAREIVAVNAVRGARPCIALDDEPIGDGTPGEFGARLGEALERV